MELEERLVRIKNLIASGRYQKKITRDTRSFQAIPRARSISVDGMDYYPYLSENEDKPVYGAFDAFQEGVFHYLVVLNYDFDYGENQVFIWFDRDDGGFRHL